MAKSDFQALLDAVSDKQFNAAIVRVHDDLEAAYVIACDVFPTSMLTIDGVLGIATALRQEEEGELEEEDEEPEAAR